MHKSGDVNHDTTAAEKRVLQSQKRYTLPLGAREIILVRHGASASDIAQKLAYGDLTLADPPLSPAGRAQAEAVAERLKREPITHIFVTPFQRTQQTAAPLAELTGIAPVVIPELREAYMGDWEHEFYVRAAAQEQVLKRMLIEESWEVIPNAEPMDDFAARVRTGVGMVADALVDGSAAVAFVQGGTIGELCRQATGSRAFAFFAPENTSISRLVVHQDGRWGLRTYNDVSHLI
jgi:2,3-bisphosphoglycerate-dependent phosphoglycerate mutase